MGFYSEVKDFIKELNNEEVLATLLKSDPRKNNISRKAREGTLQFPVLVSRALDIDTMAIINKALERNFSSFAQIAFSLDSHFQLKGKNSAVDYLKQFHSNHYVGTLGYMDFISEGFNDILDKHEAYFESLTDINSIKELNRLKESITEIIESISEPADTFAVKKVITEASASCNILKTEKLTDDESRIYISECMKWLKNDAMSMLDERTNIVKVLKESMGDLASEYITESLGNGIIVSFSVYDKAVTNVILENKQQLVDLLEDMRHDILNNKYKPSTETVYNFKNKELSSKYNKQSVTEAKQYTDRQMNRHRVKQDHANYELNRDEFDYRKERDSINDDINKKMNSHKIRQDAVNYKLSSDKFEFDKQRYATDAKYRKEIDDKKISMDADKFAYAKQKDAIARFDKYNTVDLNKNMLTDNDAKKANELVPTMLHVRINALDKNGANAGIVDFNVGIKAILHPINSDEMIANVVSACRQGGNIFNFIRWTTGEIKFIKDFLLDIDTVKLDVYNKSHGASPWWIALKRRKRISKLNAIKQNKLLPNATIVISAEEAELIKSSYGFDLFDGHFVEKLFDTYFLLGFVIVDNASQVAHFRFDNGTNAFETVPFSSLERENTNSERKFKDMLKVLSRN